MLNRRCLIEVMAAFEMGKPIIFLTQAGVDFDRDLCYLYLTRLDTQLEKVPTPNRSLCTYQTLTNHVLSIHTALSTIIHLVAQQSWAQPLEISPAFQENPGACDVLLRAGVEPIHAARVLSVLFRDIISIELNMLASRNVMNGTLMDLKLAISSKGNAMPEIPDASQWLQDRQLINKTPESTS